MRRRGLSRFFPAVPARARARAIPLGPCARVAAVMAWLGVIALIVPPAARAAAPGGFVEPMASTAVRAPNQPNLPARGRFVFPAPYNTVGARLTNASDCEGQDCVNYVGYSYWRNTNNHVGSGTMLIVLSLDRARGGGGLTLFSYDKNTDAVTKVGPIFDDASPFSWGSGEGWYFSATRPTAYYVNDGRTLYRYDVSSRQLASVFDITAVVEGAGALWQTHSSDDDRVHSATVMSPSWEAMGCVVYREDTRKASFFPRRSDFDECQIDKSGRWLVIKQQIDGANGEDNLIVNVDTGATVQFMDERGAAGHSDNGHGYMVAEDNWHPMPGAVRFWRFDQPLPGTPPQGVLVYHTTDWSVVAGHIAHGNARPGTPPDQQYACASNAVRGVLPRGNEIVCFRLDGSLQALVVAPVMTDLDASGGGDDYAKLPKGNLDVTGQYFVWTSNVGSNRLDAFVVKVPSQLLVAGVPPPPAPSEPPPAPESEPPPAPGSSTPGGADVVWINSVRLSVTGNSLTKTDGCDGCEDAGAMSKQSLHEQDGALEFTAVETTTLRYVGLSGAPAGHAAKGIRFAVALLPNGIAQIHERGSYRTEVPYASGDVFRIAVESGIVRYYKNGQLIRESDLKPGKGLWADVTLVSTGSTVTNAKFYGGQ